METPPDPLNYDTPRPRGTSAASIGCLVASILFGCGVLLLASVAVFGLGMDGHPWSAAALVGMPVIAIVAAIYWRQRHAFYPAIAITSIAAATFLLMFGLCSRM